MPDIRYILPLFALSLLLTGPVQAAHEKELNKMDQLIQARKYLSAVQLLNKHQSLKNDPRFARRYVYLLSRKYVITINFMIFALKDMKPGEKVEKIRGKAGAYTIFKPDIDNYLHQLQKKYPKSPDLQFAIGDYLSKRSQCSCGPPQHFRAGSDAKYYIKAERGGVYDAWSLFRIGYHYLQKQDKKHLERAIQYFKHAIKLDPRPNYAKYNLGIAYYFNGELKNANRYATMALGKYGSPFMDADTYNVHGRINTDLKRYTVAENSFKKALVYYPTHKDVLSGLLNLYRKTQDKEKYIKRVVRYIGQDYADPRLFNHYFEFIKNFGFKDIDRRVFSRLAAIRLTKLAEIGALHYNLGRYYHSRKDKKNARKHYNKSLKAFSSMKKQKIDAIRTIKSLLSGL